MTHSITAKSPWRREAIIAVALVLAGLLLLPIAIWWVGGSVFGSYAGDGFGGFYAELIRKLAGGNIVAWFLVLSPLLGVAAIRLTLAALRLSKT